MKQYVFGIDIGGTSIKCGLFTAEGELLDKWEIMTDRTNGGENVPKDIAKAIAAKMKDKFIEKDSVLGVGVGIPGPVLEDGTVLQCPNLGWGRMNAAQVMSDLTGLKIKAGNDANVAALGEMWKGGGKGCKNMVMITLGTGVGGGVILDGNILCGVNGAAAEIGHMIVNPEEEDICGCGGHGHLEQYASATGIVRMAKKALAKGDKKSSLASFEKLSAKNIFDEAKKGDALALELVDTLGNYLAYALTHVSAVVDPEVYVVGGGVSRAGEILINAIRKHYNNNIMKALQNKEFRLAELGNDAGIYGAARMLIGSK
ncbi:MAG: ROK family glucokinase [Lachnospiraceae bacterium]|nr:ROK family glucokinase [Lachnospiraceae bacterium]MBR6274663.1 ROK family glucokinase [Lachnospiraceae bacterium]